MKRLKQSKETKKLEILKEKQIQQLEKLKQTQELQLEKLKQSEKLDKLKKSKKLNKLAVFFREIASYHVSLYAANASFYIILAFFPFIMLVVSLLSAFGISQGDLMTALSGILPNVLMPLMERVINDMSTNSTIALISLAALAAVWSSSRGVYCIQKGLNAIHGIEDHRSYLYRRILSMIYMVFLLVALVLSLLILGFGREVKNFCANHSVPILRIISGILQFRGLIVFTLLTVLFCAMYCVFPNRKVKIRQAIPGALLAALGWLIFSLFFSLYVRYFSSHSVIYGSLSIIAFGMLWLFICMCILFYGSVFNIYFEKWRKK